MHLPALLLIALHALPFADRPLVTMRPPASPEIHVQPAPNTTVSLSGGVDVARGSPDSRVAIAVTIPLGRAAAPLRAKPLAPPPADPMARALVAAALDQAGLHDGAARFAHTAARARVAALLPELHLRILSSDTDRSGATSVDDAAILPQTTNRNDRRLWLEARAVFRLDRLLYSDDEPTLLRLRADAADARARVTAHVLTLYFHWRRAERDAAAAAADSNEQEDAVLRAEEAAAALDVATGGAFHAHDGSALTVTVTDEPQALRTGRTAAHK
jgi:hypothetical protein